MEEYSSSLEWRYRLYTEQIRFADQKAFLLVSISLAIVVFVREEFPQINEISDYFIGILIQDQSLIWNELIHITAALMTIILIMVSIL